MTCFPDRVSLTQNQHHGWKNASQRRYFPQQNAIFLFPREALKSAINVPADDLATNDAMVFLNSHNKFIYKIIPIILEAA